MRLLIWQGLLRDEESLRHSSKACRHVQRILCFHWNYMVTCVLYDIKICFYNQFWICISIRSTECNWTVDDLIFALLHLFFAKKTHLFLALIFWNLLYLFCIKLFSPSEIIFTNGEHIFLRFLVTNLRVRCFDIYAITAMCTQYYQIDSILYKKLALWTYSAFRREVSLLHFSRNN